MGEPALKHDAAVEQTSGDVHSLEYRPHFKILYWGILGIGALLSWSMVTAAAWRLTLGLTEETAKAVIALGGAVLTATIAALVARMGVRPFLRERLELRTDRILVWCLTGSGAKTSWQMARELPFREIQSISWLALPYLGCRATLECASQERLVLSPLLSGTDQLFASLERARPELFARRQPEAAKRAARLADLTAERSFERWNNWNQLLFKHAAYPALTGFLVPAVLNWALFDSSTFEWLYHRPGLHVFLPLLITIVIGGALGAVLALARELTISRRERKLSYARLQRDLDFEARHAWKWESAYYVSLALIFATRFVFVFLLD